MFGVVRGYVMRSGYCSLDYKKNNRRHLRYGQRTKQGICSLENIPLSEMITKSGVNRAGPETLVFCCGEYPECVTDYLEMTLRD